MQGGIDEPTLQDGFLHAGGTGRNETGTGRDGTRRGRDGTDAEDGDEMGRMPGTRLRGIRWGWFVSVSFVLHGDVPDAGRNRGTRPAGRVPPCRMTQDERSSERMPQPVRAQHFRAGAGHGILG